MRITKLEMEILRRIGEGNNDPYDVEYGCSTKDLASSMMKNGIEPYAHTMTDSARSELSRTLKGLVKKGLVKECRIRTYSEWNKTDKQMYSHKRITIRELNRDTNKVEWNLNDYGGIKEYGLSVLQGNHKYGTLSYGAKRWWILSDLGKKTLNEQ